MREEITSGMTVVYPDAVVAAFARNPITVEGFAGTVVEMKVTNKGNGKSATDKRSPFGGDVFFDLSYYLQVLHDNSGVDDVDYDSNISDNGLSSAYTVEMTFMNGTSTIGTLSFDVLALWASRLPMDEQTLTRFIGYPFTVSIFTPSKSDLTHGELTYAAPSESCDFPIYKSYADDVVLTTTEQTITVKAENGCGDVYLRWVDSFGRRCYWLFKQGKVTTNINNDGEFVRRNMGTDMGGRRVTKKVGTSVEICAPLVDVDTFDFLLECAASPVVDMYDNGEWVNVEVSGGDIVRERETLQDFIMTLVLPETNVQKL